MVQELAALSLGFAVHPMLCIVKSEFCAGPTETSLVLLSANCRLVSNMQHVSHWQAWLHSGNAPTVVVRAQDVNAAAATLEAKPIGKDASNTMDRPLITANCSRASRRTTPWECTAS